MKDYDNGAMSAICFILFLITIIVSMSIFCFYGYKVIRTIQKRSLNVTQDTYKNRFYQLMYNPIFKTVVLLISLTIASSIQILAAIMSIITSSIAHDYKIVDYFLNSFGVLFFAVVVLLLYNPLFTNPNTLPVQHVAEKTIVKKFSEQSEMLENSPVTTITSESAITPSSPTNI